MITLNEEDAEEVDKIIAEHLKEFEPKDFITPRKIDTLPTGYTLDRKVIHPQHSYYDPEGEMNFHIWAEQRSYHWGVEIEARYTGLGEGTPKIRPCNHIPPKLHTILKELPLL